MAAARKKSSPSKRSTAKKTTAKKTTAKKVAAKKAASKKAAAKQAAPKKAAAKKTPARSSSAAGSGSKKRAESKATATKGATPKGATSSKSPQKKATATTMSSTPAASKTTELPKPRFNKDGLGYTKDFDLSFVKEQYEALQEERVRLTGQANRLEEEAHQLVEEAEMGDVQFDDEGGEGDTMVVERERDLALSAQAREAVTEIDAALTRIADGTYGYSVVSGLPLPKERLEAIPWADVLVEEKVGGIGRR